MKLSEWAKQEGIHYTTAHRWFHEGVLPVDAIQLETGTILVQDEPKRAGAGVALYARVSSSDQKADLDRQLARLVQFATRKKLSVTKTVSEVGSGLNGKRTKLLRLLRDPTVGTIVVEHRERLARFGTEFIEATLSASGREVMVVEDGELEDDLVQDMVDVLTSLCARLYGRRSAKNRAKRALKAIEKTE
jgi:predicted site-specific integrase-resolvase